MGIQLESYPRFSNEEFFFDLLENMDLEVVTGSGPVKEYLSVRSKIRSDCGDNPKGKLVAVAVAVTRSVNTIA